MIVVAQNNILLTYNYSVQQQKNVKDDKLANIRTENKNQCLESV